MGTIQIEQGIGMEGWINDKLHLEIKRLLNNIPHFSEHSNIELGSVAL